MSELRWAPSAVLVWAVTFLILQEHPLGAVVCAGVFLGGLLVLRWWGQALLCASTGLAAASRAWWSRWQAEHFTFLSPQPAEIVSDVTHTRHGSWYFRVRIEGYPAECAVFLDDAPPLPSGTRVALSGSFREGVINAQQLSLISSSDSGVSDTVRSVFREAAASQPLLPGMVLGDTSLFAPELREAFRVAGLSHLTAVSGANVAIVTTTVVLLLRFFGCGPRIQAYSAILALLGFVMLVGTEPSVLRAGVTGVIGLLAVLNSSRMQPLHALGLSIVGLVTWNPQLATEFGFVLSVAATAGIVALSPLIYTLIVTTLPRLCARLPAVIVRAVSVAIAADAVTMPIIALMAGRVSSLSVIANVLVAPVVAPITILGLCAVACSLVGWAEPLLWVLQPFTWWIEWVARGVVKVPCATVSAEGWEAIAWILVGWGWVIAASVARWSHDRSTCASDSGAGGVSGRARSG